MKKLGKVFILGDSYSTFKGCNPESYPHYYDEKSQDLFGFNDKESTWWSLLLKRTDSVLASNDSCSGSTVCYTGYDGSDAKKTSLLFRMKNYIENGYFNENKIDALFVFGGTNDSWANSPLGINADDGDFYCFSPAVKELVKDIKQNLSNTRVIFIINCGLSEEVVNAITAICKDNNIQAITLHNVDKVNGHPTKKGMQQICDQIYDKI